MKSLWNRNFLLICISNFTLSFSFYAVLSVLPLYLNNELGIAKNEIGLILAAYTLGALVIRPFGGFMFDHFNKRASLLISIAAFAFLFLFYIFVKMSGMFMLLRLIHGFAWGVLTTGMVTVAVDTIPHTRRGEGIGYLGISMTLAMALAPPASIAFSKAFNFELLFYGTTFIAVLSFVVAAFAKISSHVSQEKPSLGKQIVVKAAIPVSFSIMLFAISYGGIMSFITLYAVDLGIANAGRFFLFLAIGLIVTRFFSGKIFDKYGPKWVIGIGFMLGISGLMVLSNCKGEFLFLTSATLVGLGFGSIVPASQAMINNVVTPQRRGASNSTFLTFFDLGIGSGMLLTGVLSDSFGYSGSYFICALISVVAMAIFFFHNLKHYNQHKIS